jgi:uracil-DNA glycosylase family 4
MIPTVPINDLWYGTRGSPDAPIVLVGESWGREEDESKVPFVGESGKELNRMLGEAGIDHSSILFTNTIAARPPSNETEWFFEPNEKGKPRWRNLLPTPFAKSEVQRLYRQISHAERKVVVAVGNYALWALTDCASTSSIPRSDGARVSVPGGITSWRGSMLEASIGFSEPSAPLVRVLPILHPASILRAWYQRAVTINDLRRIHQALSGDWRPAVPPLVRAPPSFSEAMECLETWLRRLDGGEPLRLAHDIETRRGLVTCMGFADSAQSALVIPLARPSLTWGIDSYWPEKEEAHLGTLIRKILTHSNVKIEGQNYIYDTQYLERFYGIFPRLDFDTMLAHHLLFPGTPKALDYLSSLYCKHHVYWKDDLKEWDQHINFETNLQYNAIDVMRTFEVATVLRKLLVDMGQNEQWEWEKRKHHLALSMMRRGVAIDTEERSRMSFDLLSVQQTIHQRLGTIVPQSWIETSSKRPWFRSPSQMAQLFYEVLGLPRQVNRKTDRTTANDEALVKLRETVPWLRPLFDLIEAERSTGVFFSTFVSADLDWDRRMRCSFNPAGTETFRWSSSANPFGSGTNLQNIPKGDE